MMQISNTDLSMIIYCLGLLDQGSEELWQMLEELLIENFHKLKKIDFDNSLAGFRTGSQRKGSMHLLKMFTMCTI